MNQTELLSLLAQGATAISVLIAAASFWTSVQISRRQMNVQAFTTYAERYEQIMSSFPENAFRARFHMDDVVPPESEQLTLCLLRYLNLSSEEFYLWEKKYIDQAIWEIWEDEIKRMLKSKLMEREWRKLEPEFRSYPEFRQFVEKTQSER